MTPHVVLCVGKSGAGKSNFIDLTRQETNPKKKWAHSGLQPDIKPVRSVSVDDPSTGEKILLVDTPGYDADGLDVERMIRDWTKTHTKNAPHPAAILFFHPISDSRCNVRVPGELANMITKHCDSGITIMLITTMWDKIGKDKSQARQLELESKHWRPWIDRGAISAQFDNKHKTAWKLLRKVLLDTTSRNMLLQFTHLPDPSQTFACRVLSNRRIAASVADELQTRFGHRRGEIQKIRMVLQKEDDILSGFQNNGAQVERLEVEQRQLEFVIQEVQDKVATLKMSFAKRIWKTLFG